MKRHTLIAGSIALLMLGAAASQAAGPIIIYNARSGSKMKIEGTANIIHPTWQVESPIIMGMMEVGPGFPIEAGQTVTPGKVEAKADASIQVRSLKSTKEDGSFYSDRMDEVMWKQMKEAEFKRIFYHLTELTLKEAPKTKAEPYLFEAKGDLTIAGVTNKTTMLVKILPTVEKAEKRLEVTGTITIKTRDYKVDPVDVNLVLGHIKTGEEVTLVFKWILGQKKVAAAAAQ